MGRAARCAQTALLLLLPAAAFLLESWPTHPQLDILGLVDPTIARSEAAQPLGAPTLPGHQRSNADYVFEREPDYILIPRQFSGGVAANREIWAHPDLAAHYAWDDEIVGYRRLPGRAPEPRAPR